ncbi:MAG: NAD(P)/FAD-dependent oxidoreductase [Candidatus Helarchaeota archaeon]|nr:NAD(P)/FAD-dependent oxidoreductase [Candidatus Helarchaeota archaeon]
MVEYDLVIVGAGPGGSIAAKIGAEKGLKTIFIERGRVSGEKNSSGCGLGPRMWRDFPELMKELTPETCPSLRTCEIYVLRWIDMNGRMRGMQGFTPSNSVSYDPARKWHTKNVYRSEFDPWLAKFATDAGAELKTSTLVTDLMKDDKGKVIGVKTDKGEEIRGKIVIGADGVLSVVARKSGLQVKWPKDQVTIVPQYDFSCDKAKVDKYIDNMADNLWFGANFPGAYQVFFDEGMHLGLGNWLASFTEGRKSPLAYLNMVLEVPEMKRILELVDAKPREIQSHLLPWTSEPCPTQTDNVMLVGDAAGFPCPLEAEGIYPAMITARLAAETAVEAISNGDTSKSALKRYEERWRKSSVGIEFEGGRSLQEIWRATIFNPETMKWFVPFYHEAMGAFADWSEPHIVRFKQIFEAIRNVYLPKLQPLMMKYVLPLLSDVLEEDISILPMLEGLMKQMRPKRKGG